MVGKPPPAGRDKSSRTQHRSAQSGGKRGQAAWKATVAFLSQLRSILVNGGIVLALVIIGFAVVSEFAQDRIIIEPLLVPKDFEDRGWSGEVLARQLTEEVRAIERDGATYYPVKNYTNPQTVLKSELLDPELPGNIFSLQAFVAIVQELSGRPGRRVRAEIVIGNTCSASDEMIRCSDSGKPPPNGVYGMRLHIDPEQPSWQGCGPDLNVLGYEAAAQIERAKNPFVLATYYYRKKDLCRARWQLDSIVSSHIEKYEQWALDLLANIEEDARHLEDAIKYYDKILEMKSELGGYQFKYAYHSLGNIFRQQRLYDRAIEKYQKAIKADPSFAPSYSAWGGALKNKGDIRGAIDKYQAAVKRDPKYPGAWNGWGNALMHCDLYPEAIEKYQKAIDIDPNYVDPHYGLGDALEAQGDLAGAAREYRKALALNPESADALAEVAKVLLREGQRDEAISYLEKAYRLEPDNEYVQQQLHNVLPERVPAPSPRVKPSCP